MAEPNMLSDQTVVTDYGAQFDHLATPSSWGGGLFVQGNQGECGDDASPIMVKHPAPTIVQEAFAKPVIITQQTVEEAIGSLMVSRSVRKGATARINQAEVWIAKYPPSELMLLVLACKVYRFDPATIKSQLTENLNHTPGLTKGDPIIREKVKMAARLSQCCQYAALSGAPPPSAGSLFRTNIMMNYTNAVWRCINMLQPSEPALLFAKGSYMNIKIQDALGFMASRWRCVMNALQKMSVEAVPETVTLAEAMIRKDPAYYNRGAYCIPPHFVLQSFEIRMNKGKAEALAKMLTAVRPAIYLPWDAAKEVRPTTKISTSRGSPFMTAYWAQIKKVRNTLTELRKKAGGSKMAVGSALEWGDATETVKNLLD
jgi:hypothetical protein